MKKIFAVSLVFFYVTTPLQAQLKDTTQPVLSHQSADLLFQKARKQKTTAWILLGAGAGLTIMGEIVGVNAIDDNPSDLYGLFSSQAQTGGALILVGAASMVASVPFFIASGKNKRKANVIIKNESTSISRQLHSKTTMVSAGISLNF